MLDTHTLLWFLQDDPQLPEKVGNEITNIENSCYVSIASLWEIAIKINLGKLNIKFPFVKFASYLADNDIEVLQIGFDHLIQVATLDRTIGTPLIESSLLKDWSKISPLSPKTSTFQVIRIEYFGSKITNANDFLLQ